MGASLRETGSRKPSPAVSALTGFDPARCREIADACEDASRYPNAISLDALNEAIHALVPEPKVIIPPLYCQSIDAAMTLLPGSDWEWSLERETDSDGKMFARFALGDPMRFTDWEAKTEALAICIGSLRVRAAIAMEAASAGETPKSDSIRQDDSAGLKGIAQEEQR